MKLSKSVLYLAIIGYSIALLLFQDWGNMSGTTGGISAAWLLKMCVDIGFAGAAFVRLAGPSLFAEEEADDEVAIHEEDLHFSDTALFGLFMVDVFANTAYHGYLTVMTTGAVSFYFSVWFMAEVVILFFSYLLFSHAKKAQRRLARDQRARSTIRSV